MPNSACQHLLKGLCGCPPPKPPRKGTTRKTPWARRSAADNTPSGIESRLLEAVKSGLGDQILAASEIALARVCFSKFCQQAWPVVEPSTYLEWGRHHELICTTLQALFEDWLKSKTERGYVPNVRNVLINTPPGSLKSRLIAVFLHAWAWIRAPGTKFVCVSVNEAAAQRDARDTRALLLSDWYQSSFTPQWTIKTDQDAISDFGNTVGGARLSRASGSVIVGLRGDCVTGETLIATELGDLVISALHDMSERGESLPRVWSMNHQTGCVELRALQQTRCIPAREVVEIRTQSDHLLRCTDDHLVFTTEGYTKAAHLAGRRVSVLPRTYLSFQKSDTPALSQVPVRDVELRTVSDQVPTARSGIRQACAPRTEGRPVLQQAMQDACDEPARDLAVVHAMQSTISSTFAQTQQTVLLPEMLSHTWSRSLSKASFCDMSAVSSRVQGRDFENHLLLQGVCESRTFSADDGRREFELLPARNEALCWDVVGPSCAIDTRARRVSLCDVPDDQGMATDARASHRRESVEQRSAQSDHVVQFLPYYSPQTWGDTVLSVDAAIEGGRRATVDVYDLQVEGNHNFFAGGILVHNCLIGDDLNDPEESDKQLERDKVNSLWDTNQYNRVNDPLRSLRICVQQRVHADDHSGHVLRQQGLWSPENRNGWLHVVLPAELEASRPIYALPDQLRAYVNELPNAELRDWRTRPGEPLHVARMPAEWLAGEKKRWAGTSNYAGQMQQRPTAEGGGKIKSAWFNWFRLAKGVRPGIDESESGRSRPDGCHKGDAVVIHAAHHRPGFWDFDQVVLSVDPAYKKTEKGSLWGLLAFGCKGARKYLLDDKSQRGEPDEAIAVLKQLVRTWLPDKILIEDKAGGAGMHRTLELEMAEGDVPMIELELVNPGTLDKDARVNAAIPSLANGMLYLLDGAPWLDDYVEEMSLYPNGMRNDRIDATTQAFNHIRIDDCAYPTAGAWSAALG